MLADFLYFNHHAEIKKSCLLNQSSFFVLIKALKHSLFPLCFCRFIFVTFQKQLDIIKNLYIL